MELIVVVIWVLIVFLNIAKKKNSGPKKEQYSANRSYQARNPRDTRGARDARNVGKARNTRTASTTKKQESWRNTAEVTRSDISFRGLREGEDELAYLVRKNTAYEKLLEARLQSNGN